MIEHVQSQASGAQTAAELFQQQAESQPAELSPDAEPQSETSLSGHPMDPNAVIRTEEYGPIRRVRHSHESPPEFFQRPQGMADEDLVEILQETLPQMIEERVLRQPSSPRPPGTKREAIQEPDAREPARARIDEQPTKSMLCDTVSSSTSLSIEVLTAAFLQKKLQKEIPPSNNDVELQQKVDTSKSLEWETLLGKNAIKIWTGDRAKATREKHKDRFICSRFVIVKKVDEKGECVKSGWCLQGHLDLDFHEKIISGACHSPTLHPMSRSLILQIMVSKKWTMQLGDIKGAFLEAGPLEKK